MKRLSLKGIFNRYRWNITFTFALLAVENVLNLLVPFTLGLAINDLIDHKYDGVTYFVIIYSIKLVIGVARRFYDTRTYSKIYVDTASETVESEQKKNSSDSKTVSRANLIQEITDFFEHELSQGFSSLFGVVGSVIMLFVFDYKLFIGAAVSVVLIFSVYIFSEKKIFFFNRSMNDELEKHVDIISSKRNDVINKHFGSLAKWKIKLSDLESINFGLIEFILFSLIIFTLSVAVTATNPTPGGIFSILAYVIEFADGIYMLPYIYQQKIRLNEIMSRLNSQ